MKVVFRLRDALSFLTIVPVGGGGAGIELSRAAGYFPLVGLLMGALGVCLIYLAEPSLGAGAANALVVLFLVVVTGGLHIDGLADTADGLPGPRTRRRRLEIMRSGRSGPLGVAAVTLVLLLKYSLLGGLTGDTRLLAVLSAPALARWPMVLLAWAMPPAKLGGLGHTFAGRVRALDIGLASLIVTALTAAAVFFQGVGRVAPLASMVIMAVAAALLYRRLLGGVTGDTLGATVEIGEVLVLGAFLVFV